MEELVIIKYMKRKGEKRFKTEEQLIEFMLNAGNDFYNSFLKSKGKSILSLQFESKRKSNLQAMIFRIEHEEEMLREVNDMTRDGSILDSSRYVYNGMKLEQNKRKQVIHELIGLIDLYKR
jgi:hypothetical protein